MTYHDNKDMVSYKNCAGEYEHKYSYLNGRRVQMDHNNSIIPFSSKLDELRFSVQSVGIELWKRYRDSEPVINKHAVIVLQNKNNGRLCVHPLTEFIFHYWKYRAYNSQGSTNYLCSFLNYILIENRRKYKLLSLHELRLFPCL